MSENQDKLESELKDIRALLNQICSEGCAGLNLDNNTVEPDASNDRFIPRQGSSLYQNIPNPTPNNLITNIPFFIEKNAKRAQIVLYDNRGIVLQKFDIQQHDEYAQIPVNTQNMNAGVYPYALYVDGKVIDTKQMIVFSR